MRAIAALVLLALAVPAAAQERGENRRGGALHGPGWADPSDVLAAEIAFARLAQDKGQWTAFRATAAPDAQRFAPGPVRVDADLKGRKDPPVALKWQPHAVWMACDGSYAVTRGAWQSTTEHGWFMTVWQRQKKGGYKWVLDQGGATREPVAAPEFLSAKVAECPARVPHDGAPGKVPPAPPKREKGAPPPDYLSGHADDGTLAWATTLAGAGRRFVVSLRQEGAMRTVADAEASE